MISQPPKEPIDPRIILAGERTMLAWIRTGLALMGFGFVVARFGLFLRELALAGHQAAPPSTGWSLWFGLALVVFGVAINLLAAWQHTLFLRRLQRGDPNPVPRWPLSVVVSMLLAAIGVTMTVYLLLLHP